MAAGDDVVIFVDKIIADKVYDTIIKLTARDANESKPTGLGQIVKKVNLGEWYDITFCSKMIFTDKVHISSTRFYKD